MAAVDIYEQKHYEDTFGHVYTVDFSSPMMAGGQGVVIRTTEADLALKIIRDFDTQEVLTDDRNNEKYLDLRILPIPNGLQVTLPQVALKGVEGYVMTLLNSMTEFQKAFATGKQYYEDALQGEVPDVNQKLLNFFESKPEYTPKRRAKIYAYMQTGGLRRRLMAYMKAAAILVRLHTSGLVYCDFSDKNVFISSDLNYDHVWLIDADNLTFSELIPRGFYIYTPGFGAPEFMRGGAGVKSTFYSDCFSFAVALFNTMFARHPFDGQAFQNALDECDDPEDADAALNGGEFAWILDSDDDSNDGRRYLVISDKMILSDGLRELFQQIFSGDACQNPIFRPTMIQWAHETAYAFDNVVRAESCGLDYFADASEKFFQCPFDGAEIPAVCLRSYLLDEADQKLAKIWQFTHELGDEDILVPLRILNGFACRELENAAFNLKFVNGKILIRADDADYSFSYADGAGEYSFKSYGSFWAEQKIFSIMCRNKNGRRVLIEGERNG